MSGSKSSSSSSSSSEDASSSSSSSSSKSAASNDGDLGAIRKASENKAKAIRKKATAKRRKAQATEKKKKISKKATNGTPGTEKKKRTQSVRRPPPPLELRDSLSKSIAPLVLEAMRKRVPFSKPSVAVMQGMSDVLSGVLTDLLDDCRFYPAKGQKPGQVCMSTAFSAVRDRLQDQDTTIMIFEAIGDISAARGTTEISNEAFQKLATYVESK